MKAYRSTNTVTIEGRLPGQNELVAVNRRGWQKGSKTKKNYTQWCKAFFIEALRTGRLTTIDYLADVEVTWYEPNGRRDHDNILAGLKFIFDGAIEAGALIDDSQKFIGDVVSHVKKDQDNPRVEITFTRRK